MHTNQHNSGFRKDFGKQ